MSTPSQSGSPKKISLWTAGSKSSPRRTPYGLRIKVGERWYTVQVGDTNHSPVQATTEGEIYQVEVEGLPPRPSPRPSPGPGTERQRPPRITPPPRRGASSDTTSSDNILRTPMPGRVLAVMVRPGDQVSAGDEVCVVEAMKMEQTIRANRDGVVRAVHVQPMDSVSVNDPLIELE